MNPVKHTAFTILFSCLLSITVLAQKSERFNMIISYGVDLPGGDLADRFGLNYNPAVDLDYVINDSWFFGVHGHFLLGPFVKEDVISNIRTSDGLLIGQQKNKSILTMKQRGFSVGIHAGKFINLSPTKQKHGIRLRVGSGLLSHHIIFNDESVTLNQLLGDYGRGYDRLTRGLTLEEFIGYQYISADGKINMFAGFSFVQGFTQNLRPVNFDTGLRDDRRRLDLMNGLRIGVTFNLYENSTGEDIYY